MIDEAKFIENSFRNNFTSDEPYVIYGLGKNTKVIVERCKDYNIEGLMDRNMTGETQWGLPVISIDEVNKIGVKKIVIIATSANVPIIYRRIANKCDVYGIDVYDINGEKIEKKENYCLNPFYEKCSEQELKNKIKETDVVSFDIFDTLLVRKTLYPTDIFEYMIKDFGECLPDKGISFPKVRIESERQLYAKKQPTIYDIYDEVQKKINIDDDLKRKLIAKEIETEKEFLIPREIMKSIVEWSALNGKQVCCTSDMYLTAEILKEILDGLGFTGIDKIFVSCNEGVSKSSGLYERVKKKYPGKKILHIGDNFDADIRCSKESGIDDAFHISSIYKMIDDSPAQDILSNDNSLNDRVQIGRLYSNLFNDPFLFANSKGKCVVKDNYSLGYDFIEPILATFIEWFLLECHKDNVDMLLLGSRDGLIIQKMLDKRNLYKKIDIDYRYFYSSRYACTLAGMTNEDDVKYAFTMAFDGTPEEMLAKRFCLDKNDILPRVKYVDDSSYLEDHISIILNNAKEYRRRYKRYIKNIDIKDGKLAFFDFVSSGTCQLWLENILDKQSLTGYYFIKNFDKYKEKLNIHSLFKPTFVYERQSKLLKNYIFMENIMTSYEPTMIGFSENGVPQFELENRDEKKLHDIKEIHRGILDAYDERLKKHTGFPSAELSDEIVNLLNDAFSIMEADFFKDNYLEDEFCNRSFNLEKIIEGKSE